MKSTGVKVLKYTGIILLVLSLIEILFEIFYVMHFDVLGLASGTGLASLFFMRAGSFGVQLLFSIVGVAAGYAAIFLSENDRFNSYLRYFGMALIVIYVIEGIMIMAHAATFSWIRLVVLLVLAGLYLYGSWQLGKEDQAAYAHSGK